MISFQSSKNRFSLYYLESQCQSELQPKWAKSAKDFLRINRETLESEIFSNEINNYIDLIFGYKQKGQSSVEADNVFYYLTYEGTVQLNSYTYPIERQAIRCQINEFGQYSTSTQKQICPQIKINKIQDAEVNLEGIIWENLNKKDKLQQNIIQKAHKSYTFIYKNVLVTIGNDGFLKVFDLKENQLLKSFKIYNFCLSVIVPLKQDEIFAIGSWGSQISIFNINYVSKVQVIKKFNNDVSSLVYFRNENINSMSDDEQFIAIGDLDGKVAVISTDSWAHVSSYEIPGEKVVKLLFFKTSLLVTRDSQIKLFNSGGQLLEFKVEKYNGLISDVFIDREKYLIACTKKGHLSIFSMLLESKLGYLFTDFKSQPDLIPVQDFQFTSMTLRYIQLILASQKGSLIIVQQNINFILFDLSQHKKNVVIDLFGNSKDIYHRMKTINTQILLTPHPSNVLTLIQNTPLTLYRVAIKHKNYESQENRRYSSRRDIKNRWASIIYQNVVSHHRDFRSYISIEYNPLSICNSRKNSMVFTPNQIHQQIQEIVVLKDQIHFEIYLKVQSDFVLNFDKREYFNRILDCFILIPQKGDSYFFEIAPLKNQTLIVGISPNKYQDMNFLDYPCGMHPVSYSYRLTDVICLFCCNFSSNYEIGKHQEACQIKGLEIQKHIEKIEQLIKFQSNDPQIQQLQQKTNFLEKDLEVAKHKNAELEKEKQKFIETVKNLTFSNPTEQEATQTNQYPFQRLQHTEVGYQKRTLMQSFHRRKHQFRIQKKLQTLKIEIQISY
ncbi:hypothetical protein pb186bvf_019877 [Paramecium bursaria]